MLLLLHIKKILHKTQQQKPKSYILSTISITLNKKKVCYYDALGQEFDSAARLCKKTIGTCTLKIKIK